MAMTNFRAAVVQAASDPANAMAAAENAVRLIEEMAGVDTKLAVFPEAFIGGYPKGASFGTPVGMRKPEGRTAFARYHAGAVELATVIEGHVKARSQTDELARLVPNLIAAMFTDFPGRNGETVKITVPARKQGQQL